MINLSLHIPECSQVSSEKMCRSRSLACERCMIPPHAPLGCGRLAQQTTRWENDLRGVVRSM